MQMDRYRGYQGKRRRGRARRLLPLVFLLALGAAGYYGYAYGRNPLAQLASVRPTQTLAGQPSATSVTGSVSVTPTSPATTVAASGATSTPSPAATPAAASSTPTGKPAATATTRPKAVVKVITKRKATPVVKPKREQAGLSYYTVRSGDSLWSISARNKLPVEKLASANGLAYNTEVYIGQRLLLPTKGTTFGISLPNVKKELSSPSVRPLTELSPDLTSYLGSRSGISSAAVYVPRTDTVYTHNPNQQYLAASTVKVPVMLTQLAREHERNGKAALPGTDLLVPMITVSDNAAASELFKRVGGQRAVQAELRARGLTDTRIQPVSWGLSTTTAPDMALLMRSLYYGERLNADLRRTAIGLLGSIVEPQRWGVPEGLGDSSYVAFKGGWLPTDNGWQVHQMGMAQVAGEPVIFSFYTKEQPGEVYGRETLEGAGRLLAKTAAGR